MGSRLMKIGVTGSRSGAMPPQIARLSLILKNYIFSNTDRYYRPQAEPIELHHGCCTGVDEITAYLAFHMGYRVVGHPPTSQAHMSQLAVSLCHELLPAKEYLDRNKDIVEVTSMLLVVPDRAEYLRSGTWSTKRYAEHLGKEFIVLEPTEIEKVY